ncbi:MAG: tetratricopeptide repeat protein [Planctomycetes bacterium]|nr:tetratricopeptide repeat protein [Planctomycetota bacterium]
MGSSRLRTFALALGLALAVFALYWPVRGHDFVSYDDEVYLVNNPHVAKGLDWEEIRWAFGFEHYAANYHPLTWVSHMLDVELFELEPGPHHLVNAALHALNAVLVFFLCRALLVNPWSAALAAALFALHPLRVESVAWASERKDVLCAAFFLAALLAYLRYGRAPSVGRYAWVLLLFALSLLAKPMAVTFPCVLLLLDLWPLQRFGGGVRKPPALAPSLTPAHPGETRAKGPPASFRYGLLLEKLPLVALAALGALATWYAQEVGGAASGSGAVPLGQRLLNALASYGVYLRESFWPARLAVYHPLASMVEADPLRVLLVPALLGALVLVGVSLAAWRARARWPWFLVGWLWFLGTLVPVIGLKQVGTQAHADRYTYLPLIGVAWIVGGLGLELGRAWPRARFGLGALALAALGMLTFATRTQLATWQDTPTLFEHALTVTEKNHLAHAALGAYWLERGDRERAERELRSALELCALDPNALTSLARLHIDAGELEAAERELELAKRLVATKWVRYQLGRLRVKQNDLPRAAKEFEAALALDPSLVDAHFNLGQARFNLNDAASARASFEHALALDAQHAGAWNGLGALALQAGDAVEAERCFRRAVELDADYADALNNLGVALERQGRMEEARRCYAEARALYQAQGRQP